MTKKTKFGIVDNNDVYQWRTVRIIGLEHIFAILCLIAEIMIYNLPTRGTVDSIPKKDFKEKLKEIKE